MQSFKNHKAMFGWIVSLAFLLVVGAFTLVFLLDGPPTGYSPTFTVIGLALFWMFGLAGSAFAASKVCLTVSQQPDATLVIVRRSLFKRVVHRLDISGIEMARLIESRDDEGDSYFFARTTLADGTQLDLHEGHSREPCEAVCVRFNQLLATRPATHA